MRITLGPELINMHTEVTGVIESSVIQRWHYCKHDTSRSAYKLDVENRLNARRFQLVNENFWDLL